MNELVIINGQQVVTSSRNVAEHFEKRHDHVLRDIESLIQGVLKNGETPNNEGVPKIGETPKKVDIHKMFCLSSYKNEQNGQTYPEYLMNRDGFSLLVMGFTGAKALAWKLKYIEAFNAMEKKIAEPKALTPAEQMAQGLLAAQKLLAEKDKRIEEMRPKEIFADAVSVSKTDILIGDLAKLIKQNGHDIGQKRLFAWLREKGYLIKRKGLDWNMPTQRAMEMKLFRVKETVVTHADGHTTVNKTPKVTGKGQVYFVNKFLNGSKAVLE